MILMSQIKKKTSQKMNQKTIKKEPNKMTKKKTAKKAAKNIAKKTTSALASKALNSMTIYLGSDHAGFEHKEYVRSLLEKQGIPYVDLGAFSSTKKVDYPLFAKRVAHNVVKHKDKALGILVCGTGTGMAIAANKIKGARAAFAYDEYSAKMARHDNDANILTLRGRDFAKTKLASIVRTWIETPFSNLSRHKKRIAQLEKN